MALDHDRWRCLVNLQAHQLSSLLDQQEQAMGQRGGSYEPPQVVDSAMRDYEAAAGNY